MAHNSKEARAIVLGTRDHGESDKIITFLSPDLGKFTGIAKGANRSKKRFVNKLELFTLLTVTCSRKKDAGLAFIHDAELEESFINIRAQITPYYAASLLCEILNTGTLEGQQDEELFSLFLWALSALDSKLPHLDIIAIFLIRFYDKLGYCPDFSCCRHCGEIFSKERLYRFHPFAGGLICDRCFSHSLQEGESKLSMETIQLLKASLSEPLPRLHRLRFSKTAARQSLQMLRGYGRTLFQRDIQSWKAIV